MNKQFFGNEWVLPGSAYLHKIENIYGPTNDVYVLKLFYQYIMHNNYFWDNVETYVEKFRNIGYMKLLDENVEFCSYLRNVEKTRQCYANYLYELGFHNDGESAIFELNKGQFDTHAHCPEQVITKYGNSLEVPSSTIYKYNNKIYKVIENGDARMPVQVLKLPERSVFSIHDPYNDSELIYALQTLAGTDNTVLLGRVGILRDYDERIIPRWSYYTGDDKDVEYYSDREFKRRVYKRILKCFSLHEQDYIMEEKESENGLVYCDVIVINTKNLKPFMPDDELLTNFEKRLIKQAVENHLFDE